MAINLSPGIAADLGSFLDYVGNYFVIKDLRNYRPLRRPITASKEAESAKYRRKKKLIVRDWFFYAIWATRLKKVLRDAPKLRESREKQLAQLLKLSDRMANAEKREDEKALPAQRQRRGKPQTGEAERLETEHSGDNEDENRLRELETYITRVKAKILEEQGRFEALRQQIERKYRGLLVTLRCQDFGLRCYAKDPWRVRLLDEKKPVFEAQALVHLGVACVERLLRNQDLRPRQRILRPRRRSPLIRQPRQSRRTLLPSLSFPIPIPIPVRLVLVLLVEAPRPRKADVPNPRPGPGPDSDSESRSRSRSSLMPCDISISSSGLGSRADADAYANTSASTGADKHAAVHTSSDADPRPTTGTEVGRRNWNWE